MLCPCVGVTGGAWRREGGGYGASEGLLGLSQPAGRVVRTERQVPAPSDRPGRHDSRPLLLQLDGQKDGDKVS